MNSQTEPCPILWLSDTEIVPEDKQVEEASIIPLLHPLTEEIVGYRAQLENGLTRHFKQEDHAHSYIRFMLRGNAGRLGAMH